ncbi:MAG TPA: sulfotransferase domain-containing protein [Gemmataceae bacterium]|nr:sulfotransferase domain-containing protein [Gemmataceae bacterium]
MDVFCVGMYRAGSTWQYEVVSHLVEGHLDGSRLGFLTGEQYASQSRGEEARWRVLKAHDKHPAFAAALAEGRALAVYAYRDLRDVAYSLMHKNGASFEDVVERKDLLHLCLANDAFWADQPHTLSQRYEEIMAAPAAAVVVLAAHLGMHLDNGAAEAVVGEYSLEATRRRTAEFTAHLHEQGVDLEAPTNAHRWDEKTLLHWNHIRDGRSGSWRAQATPRELAVLAGICGKWLIARGYERDLTWALPGLGYFAAELEAARQALAETRVELAEQARELEEVRRLGPVALGIARHFHRLSVRHPRLSAAVKRLLALSGG